MTFTFFGKERVGFWAAENSNCQGGGEEGLEYVASYSSGLGRNVEWCLCGMG